MCGRSVLTPAPRSAHDRVRCRVSRAAAAAPSRRPPAVTALRAPPPRKHRHRYHGVFAPNHKLRRAVTALAIGNVGKRREVALSPPLPLGEGRGEGAPNHAKPRSHDTSRIAWAKLLARLGEEFPLECPNCGGDIRLRGDGRQEPAHFEPEVRKREKARMASPA